MSGRRSKSRWANVGPTDVPKLARRWPDVGMLSGKQKLLYKYFSNDTYDIFVTCIDNEILIKS